MSEQTDVLTVRTVKGSVKLAAGQIWTATKESETGIPDRRITKVAHMRVTYTSDRQHKPRTIDDYSFDQWVQKHKCVVKEPSEA